MIRIQSVDPAEYMPQIVPLLVANWAETGFDFEFKPDLEMYHNMWLSGVLVALAAWKDDEIVGYCTVIISAHPFNREVVLAAHDAMFVRPDMRRGLLTGRLMLAAEREAKIRGANRFSWHTRAGTDFAEMLKQHGYTEADVVVWREI